MVGLCHIGGYEEDRFSQVIIQEPRFHSDPHRPLEKPPHKRTRKTVEYNPEWDLKALMLRRARR